MYYRFRLVAFDQRGHGYTHTGQDEDLSADMLVQVHTLHVFDSDSAELLADMHACLSYPKFVHNAFLAGCTGTNEAITLSA